MAYDKAAAELNVNFVDMTIMMMMITTMTTMMFMKMMMMMMMMMMMENGPSPVHDHILLRREHNQMEVGVFY